MAALFNVHVKNKEWGKAHNIYRATMTVAVFVKIPQPAMEELFGAYPEGDEAVSDMDGLFCRRDVARVELECCIKRNMAYEDMALRKQGQAAKYYSDEGYCARCLEKRRRADTPHEISGERRSSCYAGS